jgi:hypothetical protein
VVDWEKLAAARRRLLRSWAPGSTLHLNVIFTTAAGTEAALNAAGKLTRGLNASLSILAALPVPHRVPLDQPMVSPDHVRRQMLAMLPGLAAENYVRILICVCRNQREVIKQMLAPGSLVFVGGRSSSPATRERRLEKELRALGHEVIFVKTKRRSNA